MKTDGFIMAPKRTAKRGRPPSDTTMVQIAIRLPKVLLEYVDRQLQGRMDGKDRSALLRELLHEAIDARQRSVKR